jgi:hypothetical protein
MKKGKSPLIKLSKETREARKKRAASGVKFRPVVFGDKKKKQLDKPFQRNSIDQETR